MIRSRSCSDFVRSSSLSQSPDGDFFDPEKEDELVQSQMAPRHSPLTGIFLIRSPCPAAPRPNGYVSQSPDGDFFDPEKDTEAGRGCERGSQSPDGDFFDPEVHIETHEPTGWQVTVP